MKLRGHYVLDADHTPIEVDDLIIWAKWYEQADRRVAHDKIEGVEVSTIFLGLDHNYCPRRESRPILFETMVFGGPDNLSCDRYATWAEAEAGHRRVVASVRARAHISE